MIDTTGRKEPRTDDPTPPRCFWMMVPVKPDGPTWVMCELIGERLRARRYCTLPTNTEPTDQFAE